MYNRILINMNWREDRSYEVFRMKLWLLCEEFLYLQISGDGTMLKEIRIRVAGTVRLKDRKKRSEPVKGKVSAKDREKERDETIERGRIEQEQDPLRSNLALSHVRVISFHPAAPTMVSSPRLCILHPHPPLILSCQKCHRQTCTSFLPFFSLLLPYRHLRLWSITNSCHFSPFFFLFNSLFCH